MIYKINNYSLNYVVNLGEQYLTKELIKLQEQTKKMLNSEIMQERIKRDKAEMEQAVKSGLTAQEVDQLTKRIIAVAPQFFPNIKEEQPTAFPEPETAEQIIETNEKLKQLLLKLYEEGSCDFDALWEFSDEYRCRWRNGAYESWTEALEDGKAKSLVKGKRITQSIKDLQAEYHKKYDRNKDALKSPIIEAKK